MSWLEEAVGRPVLGPSGWRLSGAALAAPLILVRVVAHRQKL